MSPEISIIQLGAGGAGGFYEVPLTVRAGRGNVPRAGAKRIKKGKPRSMGQSLACLAVRTAKMMVACLLLFSIWTSASGSVQVMHKKVQAVQAGGNVTFACRSVTEEDVLQVTWQKEVDGAEDNIATYSTMNGQKIAKGYVGHVSFARSELQTSAISLHGVTLQDEGCYKCIFNMFPSGPATGRMCLKVYAISDPKVEAKLISSPDKAEGSEKVVRMSCSATGKPAPKITWRLPSILQQKPREYHVRLSNQTVTVISNFTHAHSKILQEYPIACMIQHPGLNVTLVLPTESLMQGPDTSVALAVAIVVGVLVSLTSLFILSCLLHRCFKHLCDPERNPDQPCWVGLPLPGVLQGSPPPVTGLDTGTRLCPATPGLAAGYPARAAPGLEKDEGISPQPDGWEGET
ncbi:OX-2 membrane glycoprotein-like [Falco naumanni]|uniref:OX-2 membrane glycoprotein-like n=1 Tax=Falco naumanni TaxID=148594 RepID=UPI001ADEB95D|nr:OX-2 membrane glycoprotein-like [Falco naumanni]